MYTETDRHTHTHCARTTENQGKQLTEENGGDTTFVSGSGWSALKGWNRASGNQTSIVIVSRATLGRENFLKSIRHGDALMGFPDPLSPTSEHKTTWGHLIISHAKNYFHDPWSPTSELRTTWGHLMISHAKNYFHDPWSPTSEHKTTWGHLMMISHAKNYFPDHL